MLPSSSAIAFYGLPFRNSFICTFSLQSCNLNHSTTPWKSEKAWLLQTDSQFLINKPRWNNKDNQDSWDYYAELYIVYRTTKRYQWFFPELPLYCWKLKMSWLMILYFRWQVFILPSVAHNLWFMIEYHPSMYSSLFYAQYLFHFLPPVKLFFLIIHHGTRVYRIDWVNFAVLIHSLALLWAH